MAVHEELRAALGTTPYELSDVRRGYRHGTKVRTLTGPTGPAALTLPRATLFAGAKEWTSPRAAVQRCCVHELRNLERKAPKHALAEIRDDFHRVVHAGGARSRPCRTTNTIERLHEEFRRRVKTQGSMPSEDAAVVLLFGLAASGQIRLRKIDGWRKIAAVLSQHAVVAA